MNPQIWKRLTLVLAAVLVMGAAWISWQPAAAERLAETGEPPVSSQGGAAQPRPERGAPLDEGARTSGANTPRFYNVPGSVFVPVDGTVSTVYDYMGCIHTTAGLGVLLNTPLDIPPGSRVVLLRMYYDDTSTNSVDGWITRYNEYGTDFEDLASISSSGSAGHGSSYDDLDHIVDTYNWRYVLNARFNQNSSSLQLCGMRVMYYPPITYGAFMPQVSETSP